MPQQKPMPKHPEDRLRWARWSVSALGILFLAMGNFISGGWPLIVLGLLVVVGAALLRQSPRGPRHTA